MGKEKFWEWEWTFNGTWWKKALNGWIVERGTSHENFFNDIESGKGERKCNILDVENRNWYNGINKRVFDSIDGFLIGLTKKAPIYHSTEAFMESFL